MNNRLSKLSIAAAMIIGVSLLVHWFFAGGSSVAFAAVLQKICNSSYTFDLNFSLSDTPSADSPIRGSILEPGRMRLDCPTKPGLGPISSIIDGRSGNCLILFHQQKAAELLTNPMPSRHAGGGGFMVFVMQPIRELWNLRDGSEKSLGKKTIDGVEVEGFEVHINDEGDIPRDQLLYYTIRIWADARTAAPVLVEIATTSQGSPKETIEWSMNHFRLDVQLDESLFRMEPPTGYTLSHQKDLKEVVQQGTTSSQGKIVVEAMTLATEKKLDEAIAKLLMVDWNKPMTFDGSAYLFTMTERQYVTLKPEDQKKVIENGLSNVSVARLLAKRIHEKVQPLIEAGQGGKAEPMLIAGEQLGRLLMNDPERMVIIRLVGIAVQKMMLTDLCKLYESQNKTELLRKAQQRLQAVQAEGDAIKKQATGQ